MNIKKNNLCCNENKWAAERLLQEWVWHLFRICPWPQRKVSAALWHAVDAKQMKPPLGSGEVITQQKEARLERERRGSGPRDNHSIAVSKEKHWLLFEMLVLGALWITYRDPAGAYKILFMSSVWRRHGASIEMFPSRNEQTWISALKHGIGWRYDWGIMYRKTWKKSRKVCVCFCFFPHTRVQKMRG